MFNQTIAILGGGNGAHAMVAYLSNIKLNIKWWMVDEDICQIQSKGTIKSIGALEGEFPVALISNKLEDVVDNVKIIFVIVPANSHNSIANLLAKYLKGGEIIMLCPGRTAGALAFYRKIKYFRKNIDITVGETESLFVTCRKIEPGFVDILKIKDYSQSAFLGKFLEKEYSDFLLNIFPAMEMTSSTLNTSLANVGAILHPAPVLLNTGRIESQQTSFKHYYEGITPSIASFLEKMDNERIEIGKRLNINLLTTNEWHYRCYGLKGNNLYETIQKNERYASLEAPKSLHHRYIFEEIPTGLIPLYDIAQAIRVETPYIKVIIDLAKLMLNTDFSSEARTFKSMKIPSKGRLENINKLFKTGC